MGLAQGIQPLISRSRGEGDEDAEKYFLKKGISLNFILAIVVYLIMVVFGKNIIAIFNNDPQLIEIAYNCIIIYGINFIFASINIVYTTYYLATGMTKPAIIIAVLRSFIINTICIFLFPAVFGINAIWIGMIFAEMIVMIISLCIDVKIRRQLYYVTVT